ncbi:transglycosylase SLT domain-containing protein [Kiloniella spongiae]|uniref:transglycosylase SLT domain-containing protein n=1 Tax=Kiloniella spongiae TaxID=1489064 RepID=UPI00069984DD|nr:transglycosylase SLT domain-containing protein [Kiloniella spongiae]
MPRNLLKSLAFAVGVFASANAFAQSLTAKKNSDICADIITETEIQKTIPLHLLRAISLVESGKWDKEKGSRVAWPWTVMAEGKGRYLPTKQAAIAEVQKLKAKGVKNIDVGCMQVNLYHHAKAFKSLNDAFDPHKNVAYAAKFLVELRGKSPSWTSAVGRYHSYNQKYSTPYRRKVLTAWRDEKHRINKEMRLAALEKRAQDKIAKQQAKTKKHAEIHARNPGGVAATHLKTEGITSTLGLNLPQSSSRKKITATTEASPKITQKPNITNPAKDQATSVQATGRSIATRILFEKFDVQS